MKYKSHFDHGSDCSLSCYPGLFGTLWEDPNMEESEEPIKARHINITKQHQSQWGGDKWD
jgi:hypothetical protein